MADTQPPELDRDRDTLTPESSWIRDAVREHARPLIRYATRLLAGDAERARDVVQDVFVRLCQSERDPIEDHLVEWLYTVCRNRALDVLRKERRMKLATDLETKSNAPGDPTARQGVDATIETIHERHASREAASNDGKHDAHASVEQPETTTGVLQLLGNLPDNQQEVIRLKFQGGLSYKEIARITELSVSNVGFLIHTGLKKLREQLGVDTNPNPRPAVATSVDEGGAQTAT